MIPNSSRYIGIDIGGTNTKLGLIDDSGSILVKESFSTSQCFSAEAFCGELTRAIAKLKLQLGTGTLEGIGIGAPAVNYFDGSIGLAANLNWNEPIYIKDFLEDSQHVPVQVTNDANLAALGEKHFGAGRELNNFISITIGTGLGGGIIANGSLIQGNSGLAGEIGHVTVVDNGRACHCGRYGCLETYVSASGIVKTALEMIAKEGVDRTILGKYPINELTSEKIVAAVEEGDELAHMVLRHTGTLFGKALANVAVILAPEAIFISGGPTNAGDVLLDPTVKAFNDQLLRNIKGKIEIKFSSHHENDISMLGAASMVMKNKNYQLKETTI